MTRIRAGRPCAAERLPRPARSATGEAGGGPRRCRRTTACAGHRPDDDCASPQPRPGVGAQPGGRLARRVRRRRARRARGAARIAPARLIPTISRSRSASHSRPWRRMTPGGSRPPSNDWPARRKDAARQAGRRRQGQRPRASRRPPGRFRSGWSHAAATEIAKSSSVRTFADRFAARASKPPAGKTTACGCSPCFASKASSPSTEQRRADAAASGRGCSTWSSRRRSRRPRPARPSTGPGQMGPRRARIRRRFQGPHRANAEATTADGP